MEDKIQEKRAEFIAEHSEEGLKALQAWDACKENGVEERVGFFHALHVCLRAHFGEVGAEALKAFTETVWAQCDTYISEARDNAAEAGVSLMEYVNAAIAALDEEEQNNAKN